MQGILVNQMGIPPISVEPTRMSIVVEGNSLNNVATRPFVDLWSLTYHSFGREGGEETKSSYGVYPRCEE